MSIHLFDCLLPSFQKAGKTEVRRQSGGAGISKSGGSGISKSSQLSISASNLRQATGSSPMSNSSLSVSGFGGLRFIPARVSRFFRMADTVQYHFPDPCRCPHHSRTAAALYRFCGRPRRDLRFPATGSPAATRFRSVPGLMPAFFSSSFAVYSFCFIMSYQKHFTNTRTRKA